MSRSSRRWYLLVDKLGRSSGRTAQRNNASVEAGAILKTELLRMVKDLENHPSIVVGVFFYVQ